MNRSYLIRELNLRDGKLAIG